MVFRLGIDLADVLVDRSAFRHVAAALGIQIAQESFDPLDERLRAAFERVVAQARRRGAWLWPAGWLVLSFALGF